MIADQCWKRVELMHSRHLIYYGIKSANFVSDGGMSSGSLLYYNDFGLSKWCRHRSTLQHFLQIEGQSLSGTPHYASINNHL